MINMLNSEAYKNAPKLIQRIWDRFPDKSELELCDILIKMWSEQPTYEDWKWFDETVKRYSK
jgi:hypothetical protein